MAQVSVRRDVRWFWAALSVLLIGGIVGSLVLAGKARAREEEGARTNAESAVQYGLVPLFEPADVEGPIRGDRYSKLASEIRANIVSKGPYDKINVWGVDGTVLFSTDPALVDQHLTGAQKQLVHDVIRDGARSRPVGTTFQSFVPLRLRGRPVTAVAELDQPYGPVWAAANKPWRILAILLGVLSFSSILMFALTFRPAGRPSGVRMPHWGGRRPDQASGGGPASVQSSPAFQSEVQARLKAEQRAKDAEQRAREADEQFQKALKELRASEARAKQSQAGAQGPLDELTKTRAELQNTGQRLRRVEAERSSLEEALQKTRQQLAEASSSPSADPAAREEARAAEGRAADLERRLAEAQARAEAAEQRFVAADARVAEAEGKAAAAAARTVQIEGRAADAEGKAATARSSVAEMEERLRAARTEVVAAEHRASSAETRASDAERKAAAAEAKIGADVDARVRIAEAQVAEAQEKLRQVEERARAAEAKAADAAALLGQAEAKADQSKAAATAAEADVGEATDRAREFEAQAAEATVRAQGAEGRLSQMQRDLESAEARAEQAAVRIRELESLEAQYQGQVQRSEEDHGRQLDEVRGALEAELGRTHQELEATLAATREQYEATLAESKAAHEVALRELLARHDAELSQVRFELEGQVAQTRSELETLIAETEQQRGALEADLRSATEQLVQAESRVAATEQGVALHDERARHAEARVTELQAELEVARADDLSEELRLAKAQERRALEDLHSTQEKLAKAQAEVRAMQERMAQLEARTTAQEQPDLEEVLRLTQERLTGASTRLQQMEDRAHGAERELHEVRDRIDREVEAAIQEARLQLAAETTTAEGHRVVEASGESIEDRRAAGPFLAALSQDARTSLTRILGLVLTLKHQTSPAEQAPLLKQLASHTRKLDHVVSDLLDADRLARGHVSLNLRRTDVEALVRRVIEESGAKGERQIQVRSERVIASVDPIRVEQIVSALLASSVNRSGPGETLVVRIESADGGAIIAVEDDEPASDAAMSPVVSRFAVMHGGWARVEGRPGGGSSFRVFLPEAPPATTEPPAADIEGEAGAEIQTSDDDAQIEVPRVVTVEAIEAPAPPTIVATDEDDPKVLLRELGMVFED